MTPMKNWVSGIILLAGSSRRYGGDKPKQFLNLGGKPLYRHAYGTFQNSSLFSEIILVCPVDELSIIKAACPSAIVVAGGKTRQESSYNGLMACHKNCKIALIHDAARPFVSRQILEENITKAAKYGAVDTCIPAVDTMVIENEGVISEMPDRRHCFSGQTPQTFQYDLIVKAHQSTCGREVTDDCSLVHAMGAKVSIVNGDRLNFKVTTAFDFQVAEMLLERADETEMGSGIAPTIDR